MDKTDIPQGQGIDIENTDLDVPDLPDPWSWSSANHTSNHKVNVYFGYDIMEVDGQYGEIDNYTVDGGEKWGLHIRPIVSAPETPHGTIPRAEAEVGEEFDSLEAAIEAVPRFIREHYGDDE